MLKVCIDGFNLALPTGTGIATYSRNLLSALREVGASPQVLYGPPNTLGKDNVLNEAIVADGLNEPKKLKRSDRFIKTVMTRFGRDLTAITPSGEVIWPSRAGGKPNADTLWAATNLFSHAHRSFQVYRQPTPVRFLDGPMPDAMHWTSTLPLHAKGVANIYTIHDLIPLRLPHATLENKATYRALCGEIASRADHIAVVSETTRQDVIRLLNVSEDRVTNTYQAVHLPTSLTDKPVEAVVVELEGIFNLGWKDYFLYFGAIEPKKNVGRIVEGYLASGSRRPLVIVGGRAWLEENELALMHQVHKDGGPSAQRLRRYDYLPFPMLVSLIRGARATLFPSLYEGFGLPVLESMLLGTACLTSTQGSLPEVAGDAALTVDPYEAQAIAKGIQALDADDGLVDDLVTRGRTRSALFSQDAYEGRVRGMYASLGLI